MRKILLTIVIILLLVFCYNAIVKSVTIGDFHISSIKEIDENNKKLDEKTEEVNSLIDVTYPKENNELNNASKAMQEIKERYLKETSASSEQEIESALQVENYDIERLYVKLGMHAKEEGVQIKFTLSSPQIENIRDLNFTVEGTYIAITNFLYSIEDDDELKFRIYNFKLLPYKEDILQASFTVRNVRVTQESIKANSSVQNTTAETDNSNQSNNNGTNTTKN